jgi:hypothetical protein
VRCTYLGIQISPLGRLLAASEDCKSSHTKINPTSMSFARVGDDEMLRASLRGAALLGRKMEREAG